MGPTEMKYIAIGAMAIGMAGAAIGVGNIFAALMNGIARNPSAADKMSARALIGAAMAEAMGIFALVIGFIVLFT
jgi:F-type H+-transporting ATPase subunit c